MHLKDCIIVVAGEITRARAKHPVPFHSRHEGIAILEEEFLEAREEVFHGKDKDRLKSELIQVASMAIRMIEDLKL